MKQCKVKILRNEHVTDSYFKLSFNSPWSTKELKPGQFLEVKVSNGLEPFLRKPFSIHSVKGHVIEILYEVVGKGTDILSQKRHDEDLDIIGPLGNGFILRETRNQPAPACAARGGPGKPETRILVAGGIGVAPLLFLAQKLTDQRPKTRDQRPIVLIGARTKKDILCEKEFKDLGCDVRVATDDGSKGHKGFVTELLENLLNTQYLILNTIYACGPKLMLREVAEIAKKHKIPCQVLLEEYMACGVGACLGCAVMTKDGYKMVCKDGPVFEASEVIWE